MACVSLMDERNAYISDTILHNGRKKDRVSIIKFSKEILANKIKKDLTLN